MSRRFLHRTRTVLDVFDYHTAWCMCKLCRRSTGLQFLGTLYLAFILFLILAGIWGWTKLWA